MLARAVRGAGRAARPRLDRLRVRGRRERAATARTIPTGPRSVYGRTQARRRARGARRVARLPRRAHELGVRRRDATSSRRCSRRPRRGAPGPGDGPAARGRRSDRVGRPTPSTSPRRSCTLAAVGARAVVYICEPRHREPGAIARRASRSTRPATRDLEIDRDRDGRLPTDAVRPRVVGARHRARRVARREAPRRWQDAVPRLPALPPLRRAANGG